MKLHRDYGVELQTDNQQKIMESLRHHDLVIIRGKDFTKKDFQKFVRSFGPLVGNYYSFAQGSAMAGTGGSHGDVGVVRNKKGFLPLGGHGYINSGVGTWHYDGSSEPIQGFYYSAIYGKKTLEVGGNTDFLSLRSAYERLSTGMKATLRSLEVINQNRPLRTWTTKSLKENKVKFDAEMACEEVNKGPIIIKDQMGRESLSFNPRGWVRFEGWSEEESSPILEFLTRHCTLPEHTIRHYYQQGDVILWCNNTVLHYPVVNYDIGEDREIWQLKFSLERKAK